MTQSKVLMVPFCAADLSYIDVKEEQRHDIYIARGPEYTKLVGEFLEKSSAKTRDGRPISFTLMDEERILGCIGIYENFEGSGEAWALFSKDAGRYKYILYREMSKCVKDYDFVRLQTCARADFKDAQKLIVKFGFKKEARLKKATCDGKDLLIYSMVR